VGKSSYGYDFSSVKILKKGKKLARQNFWKKD
jgi:hypothetical protein